MNYHNKLENFIKKAKTVWGDKFNYSNTTFLDATIAVNIECPQHGQFRQLPFHHLKGINGCGGCDNQNQRKKTTKEFITSAKAVWGDRWDYSDSIYSSDKSLIKIICKKHGAFNQTVNSHLKKSNGCKLCVKERVNIRAKTNKQFINEAKAVWGDRWDYSQCNYVSCRNYVTIICKKHGEFQQIASQHLNGILKCAKCKKEKGIKDKKINFTVNPQKKRTVPLKL